MNSTSPNPAVTMRLTALPPPPPTPMTLIRAPARTTVSSRRMRSLSEGRAVVCRASIVVRLLETCGLGLEEFLEQRAQASSQPADRTRPHAHRLAQQVPMRVDDEPD